MTGEKKTLCKYGKIDISKNHVYSLAIQGYQISPLMQEKMVYVAQMNCYQESKEVLEKMLGISVSSTQIHRVANTYGALIEQNKLEDHVKQPDKSVPKLKKDEVVYGEADGSMILTREDGWKEVKVGRIFKSSDCLSLGSSTGERGWIKSSTYEAYLGDHHEFIRRMETQLAPYQGLGDRLVFISDGATWIRNWITDAYPHATQILDWYHCKEHLCAFAEVYFEKQDQRKKWIADQSDLLYDSKTAQVIRNLDRLKPKNKEKKTAQLNLISYYQNNEQRMDYKKYRSMGACIIGSGAIEAAHRTVIQKRMKLSGQRWSKTGSQNMLQLRTTNLSGNWKQIVQLIRCSQINAAA
jgi:Uncharacterised protein family (UPF0236)